MIEALNDKFYPTDHFVTLNIYKINNNFSTESTSISVLWSSWIRKTTLFYSEFADIFTYNYIFRAS